jgi:hypothetical protein
MQNTNNTILNCINGISQHALEPNTQLTVNQHQQNPPFNSRVGNARKTGKFNKKFTGELKMASAKLADIKNVKWIAMKKTINVIYQLSYVCAEKMNCQKNLKNR